VFLKQFFLGTTKSWEHKNWRHFPECRCMATVLLACLISILPMICPKNQRLSLKWILVRSCNRYPDKRCALDWKLVNTKSGFVLYLNLTKITRISLSFQGFQLLVVALYNFHETIYNDIGYLDNRQLHLRGSPKAVAGGLFFLLTVTSSLYHLAFMSGQRFYAIKWPLKYRINNKTSVPAGLLAVWMLSILSASVPGEQCSISSFPNIL